MVTVWPLLLDMCRDDCKRVLRRLELEAYASIVSALRAQGSLTNEKKKLLSQIATVLSISTERHRAEVRRAVNDEKLTTVAERLSGSNNSVEWSIEGRRLVPLLPRLVPQTAFIEVANEAADNAFTNNQTLPVPADTYCKEGAHMGVASSRSSKTASSLSVVLPSGFTLPARGSEIDDYSTENSLKRKHSKSLSSASPNEVANTGSVLAPVAKSTVVGQKGTSSYGTSTAPSDGLLKITVSKSMTSVLPPQPHTGKQKVIIVPSSSALSPGILERSQNLTTSRYSPVSSFHKSQGTSGQLKSNMSATLVTASMKQSTSMPIGAELTRGMPTTTVSPATTTALTSAVISASSALLTRQKMFGKGKICKATLPSTLPVSLQSKLIPGQQKPTIKLKHDSGVKIITKTIPGSGKVVTKPVSSTSATSAVISSKPISTLSGSSGQVLISSVGGARIVTTSPQFSKSAGQISNIITVTPKSLHHVVGSKVGTSPVMMSKPYSSTASSISKPNVIVVQKGQAPKALNIHRTIPVTNDVQRQILGHDVSSSSISRPRISMISSSSVTSPNIITSTIRFPSPQYTKASSQVVHKSSMLELMGALKANKDAKIKTQVIIRPKNLRSFQDGKDTVSIHDRVLSSDVEKLLTVRRTANVSPNAMSTKYISPASRDDGTSSQLRKAIDTATTTLVSGSQPNTEWIDYDTATADQSASSAIKALLEFRGNPVKAAGDAHRRSHTIDLSKMAKVPMVTKKSSTKGLDSAPLKLQFVSQGKATKTVTPQQLSTIESEQAASIIKDIGFQTEQSSPVEVAAQKELQAPQTAIQVTPTQMSFVDQFEEFLEKEGLSGIVDDTLQDTISGGRDLLQTAAELTLLKEDILGCDLLPEATESASEPSTSKKPETTPTEPVATTEKEFDPYEFDSREDSPVDTYIGKVLVDHAAKPTSDPHISTNPSARATPVMVETSGVDLSHMQMEDFASQRLEESLDQDDVMTDSTTSATCQSQEEATQFSSSSDTSGLADSPGNVRASKRKRKAPIAIDEDASPSQLPSWTRAALNLLQRVSRFRGTNRSKGDPNAASWFTRPVSAIEAPNYHTIVTNPMDFGTIKRKLESQAYEDINGFHKDMLQVRINCSLYNPADHQVRVDCEEVFQFYTAEYFKVVDKCQKMQLSAPKSPKRLRPADSQPKSPSIIQDL